MATGCRGLCLLFGQMASLWHSSLIFHILNRILFYHFAGYVACVYAMEEMERDYVICQI